MSKILSKGILRKGDQYVVVLRRSETLFSINVSIKPVQMSQKGPKIRKQNQKTKISLFLYYEAKVCNN